MTRQDALNELNLPAGGTDEDIAQAYRRLVRRYPPELNPERFRRIDEAYRYLTSLPDMIERIFSQSIGAGIAASDLCFSAILPPEAIGKALESLSCEDRMAALWSQSGQSKRRT